MWAGALETLASLPWKERICCSRSGDAAPLVECLSSMWRALDQSLAPCKLDVMVGGSEEVQGHPQLCSEASLDYTRPYLKKKKVMRIYSYGYAYFVGKKSASRRARSHS